MTTLPLALTAGEPAGIGPDLCIAMSDMAFRDQLLVIADPATLKARAEMLGRSIELLEWDPAEPLPADRKSVV